ncbi:MAG TPA: serine hydrolase domain-containing protein [Tenuifilaceae bacterium]|nr:serine hydrolase domain-containing protein [Tenuifilaceae bacterium]HPQ35413.1 serine hydrolase domain-containing protein [Tenuifilaceae bacterium]
MKNLFALFVFTFLISPSLKCQELNYQKLDSFINKTIQEWDVPGVAVSIVQNSEIVYQKGFGVKELKTNEKVTPQTLFYIASASKPFTSTLSLLLLQENKLDIDIPVQNYISDFSMVDSFASQRVTLRDMMTHRTGIAREKFFTLNNINSRKDVRHSYSLFEPAADFRTAFIYSNENFTVAGDIIAEAAGDSWENLVKSKIFVPLGMSSTLLSKNDLTGKNYAKPYIDWGTGNEPLELYDSKYLGAAGCIISNVEDLSSWILLYLNRGKVNENQLISKNLLAQQLSAQIPTKPLSYFPEVSFECYGIGWFLDYYRGNFHVHHGGVLYGYTSLVSFLPQKLLGVAILANKNNTPATNIIEKYIYDNMLGLEVVDWNGRFKQQEERMLAMMNEENSEEIQYSEISTDEANRYVGTYYCKGFGEIQIRLDNGKLLANMRDIDCEFKKIDDAKFELYHPVEHQGWEVDFEVKKGKSVGFFVAIGINNFKVFYKNQTL